MSFVLDQVRRIDAQLDRLQLSNLRTAALPLAFSDEHDNKKDVRAPPARILALQAAIRGLSPGSALLPPSQIQFLLSALSGRGQVSAAIPGDDEDVAKSSNEYEMELEWLLASKATTQVYAHCLDRILYSAVKIADDIWYWDELLSSRRYTALYSLQTSPLRLWDWGSGVWDDVKARAGEDFSMRSMGQDAQDTVTQSWREFYHLCRRVIRERSVREVHKQMLSPVTRLRGEMREKQKYLKRIRLRNANALGVLLGEGLANESVHGEGLTTPGSGEEDVQQKWKVAVARNVALMEAVLAKVNDLETPVEKFDTAIAELTEDDPLYTVEVSEQGEGLGVRPQAVAERLSRVLKLGLPLYGDSTQALIRAHGKPSRLTRYWLPVTLGIISSSTILRILVARQAEILQWIQDLGATTLDFWTNWVVEPTRKVIKTIRHDEGSEVSIMSKRSLEGDRDSLERMVVEFAIDNPGNASDSGAKALSEAEIADVRAKVREGDLTPVLKAYEKDLTKPFMGTVRGNLIRALLIQVQKTKVDVEVAMGGIDALLKSQELVFGFVGLTPGILVTYFLLRSLRSSLTEKRGSKAVRKHGKMLRQLRNIDRILVDSTPTDFGELHYRDQGLLLCEVHVLRQAAEKLMPGEIYKEFSEEAEELCDVRVGVEKQKMVADRMRWAYGRWLA